MEIVTPTAKNRSKKQSEPVDIKKKKKTKMIEIEVSESEPVSESESESESEEKAKPKAKKVVEKTTTKRSKVSDVKEPKKSRKPQSSSVLSVSAKKSKKETDHKKKKEKETKKKHSHATSSADEDGGDTNEESDAPRKKVILKKDQDLEIPEMTRLIAAYVSGADEKKIQNIYNNWPKLYDRLVTLVKPYRRVWCYSSCPGRLILRVKGDNFVMVNTLDNIVTIEEPYTKKEDFPLEKLYKKYVGDDVVDKNNRDSRLFELLSAEDSLTDSVSLVNKMQQCIIHDAENEKSYWINTPEGREKLGPVINTNIKKFDDDTIANEIAKVVAIRNEIIEIFATSKNSPPPPDSKRSSSSSSSASSKSKHSKNDEKKNTKKRAADESDEEDEVKEIKKKKLSTPPPSKSNKKESTTSVTVKEKSPPKKSEKEIKSKKVESVAIPEPKKSPVKIRKSVVKPTATTVTTTVVDVDEETKARIMKMSSAEIHEMLMKEKKRIDDDNKVEFENVEWYERFDVLMGTNSKTTGTRVPFVKTH